MPFTFSVNVPPGQLREVNSFYQILAPQPAVRIPSPIDGALLNLVVLVLDNSLTGPAIISIAINGIAVINAPVPLGYTGLIVIPAYYPIPAGSPVSFLYDTTAAGAGSLLANASSLFVPALPPPP